MTTELSDEQAVEMAHAVHDFVCRVTGPCCQLCVSVQKAIKRAYAAGVAAERGRAVAIADGPIIDGTAPLVVARGISFRIKEGKPVEQPKAPTVCPTCGGDGGVLQRDYSKDGRSIALTGPYRAVDCPTCHGAGKVGGL